VVETLKVKKPAENGKLDYKAKEQSKYLVKIDQSFASSKTCSCCGHKADAMPLSRALSVKRSLTMTSMPRSISGSRAF
jgi:transposase